MSKSKSKGPKGAAPAQDVLTKVKDAAITKPAQTVKAKSKEIARQVAGKEEKRSKSKKAKEPTPESSDAESEDESGKSESSEGSESEEEVEEPVKNGKVNGTAAAVPRSTKKADSDSDDSEADSDESGSSENEALANGVHSKAPAAKQANEESSDEEDEEGSDDDSDAGVPAAKGVTAAKGVKASESDDDEEEEDDGDEDDSGDESDVGEAPAKNKGPVKAEELSKKLNPIAADTSSGEDSDEDSDDSAAASDDSEEGSSDDEEVKPTQPAKAKRKAEDVAAPAAKKSKTAEAGADNNQGGNLFVGNLSWNVDEEWLTREFEEFGELSGVRIITDRATGRSKGFGYVEFVNAGDAAKAHAAKKGALIDNRALNLDFANKRSNDGQQDRAQSRAKSFGDSTSPPSDTLFVGNLSFDAGQETVSEAFGEWGTVLGVRLPTDRETGDPKGFGYVTFSSVDEAKAALENMQGAEIGGRACRLDFSQPRPQNGESGGRGGGGFGGRGGGRGGFGGRGGGRGGFGDRGGRGGRGRGGFGDRGARGGRGGSTNRGGFGDFSGKKVTF